MNRIIYTFFLVFFFGAIAFAQTYPIGHRSINFTDPSRSNRLIQTEIYYPGVSAGDNVDVNATESQYPVVIFGHGFVMVWSAYQNIWEAIVPKGFIAVFPKSEGSISPSHTDFAKDLAFLVTAMQQQGSSSISPFYNRIANQTAVMGHSMGGGCALLSYQYNPNIQAIAVMAPAETNPSAISQCLNIVVPAIIFQGGSDCITPAATNATPMYNALASGCKQYVTITGGSHCQFANYNFNCSLGEATCGAAGISREQQQATLNSLMVPWLQYRLKTNCGAWDTFQNLLNAGAGISSQQSCPGTLICPTPGSRSTTNITLNSAKLNWGAVSCSHHYVIQYRINGSSAWTNKTVYAPNTNLTLTNLQPSTTYKWRMRTFCSTTSAPSSGWSTQLTFKTRASQEAIVSEEGKDRIHFSVFPNPGTDHIQIIIDQWKEQTAELSVWNTLGTKVYSQTLDMTSGDNLSEIDLPFLTPGIYFFRLSGEYCNSGISWIKKP